MKLYYLARIEAPTDRNASGIQIFHTCEALGRLGHDIELIVLNRRSRLQTDPFVYFGVEKVFRVKTLWSAADLVPAWLFRGRLGMRLEILAQLVSAKLYLLPRQGGVLYTREPLATAFFKDAVLEVHTLPESMGGASKWAHRRARRLITISEGLQRKLVACGISGSGVLVAPDGVDLAAYKTEMPKAEARRRLSLPPGMQIVVYTGRISSRRGLDVLAEAAVLLGGSVHIYVVGGAEMGSEAFLRTLEDIPNFHVMGYRPHQEIPVWQRAADILVLPSKASDPILREYTSPMKLFEYMAAERPIVSSDLPSVREVLDESCAAFFSPGDAQALADRIEGCLQDPRASEEYARKARLTVEGYTWQTRAERIARLLESDQAQASAV